MDDKETVYLGKLYFGVRSKEVKPVENKLEKSDPWVWSQDLVGKIIIRTAPHPRTGCRSYIGTKLKVTAITDKLIRAIATDDVFLKGKEILLSMEEYGYDGQWELN